MKLSVEFSFGGRDCLEIILLFGINSHESSQIRAIKYRESQWDPGNDELNGGSQLSMILAGTMFSWRNKEMVIYRYWSAEDYDLSRKERGQAVLKRKFEHWWNGSINMFRFGCGEKGMSYVMRKLNKWVANRFHHE